MDDLGRHLCPFCREECTVGWDCSCGAKAVNSAIWFEKTKPLMRHKNIGDMGLVLRVMSKKTDEGLKEMIKL